MTNEQKPGQDQLALVKKLAAQNCPRVLQLLSTLGENYLAEWERFGVALAEQMAKLGENEAREEHYAALILRSRAFESKLRRARKTVDGLQGAILSLHNELETSLPDAAEIETAPAAPLPTSAPPKPREFSRFDLPSLGDQHFLAMLSLLVAEQSGSQSVDEVKGDIAAALCLSPKSVQVMHGLAKRRGEFARRLLQQTDENMSVIIHNLANLYTMVSNPVVPDVPEAYEPEMLEQEIMESLENARQRIEWSKLKQRKAAAPGGKAAAEQAKPMVRTKRSEGKRAEMDRRFELQHQLLRTAASQNPSALDTLKKEIDGEMRRAGAGSRFLSFVMRRGAFARSVLRRSGSQDHLHVLKELAELYSKAGQEPVTAAGLAKEVEVAARQEQRLVRAMMASRLKASKK
ncbi:hypothetical protein HY628_02100 [Candidatus Uhrbacteria bacterium]|nr:hypothetical protein [Candidatus Uhrbacteria bacterium]